MIDTKRILDQLLGAGGPGRPAGSGPQGGLGDVLGQIGQVLTQGGGLQTRPGPVGGGGGGDLLARAKDFLGTQGGSFAGGAAAGALAGLLLGSKGGRKIAGNAAKLGGLAVLGGLAYLAYQNYRQGRPVGNDGMVDVTPTPAPPAQLPGAPPDDREHALLVIRTMIAAAAADGRIDEAERGAILGQLVNHGFGGEEAAFIAQESARPLSVGAIAAYATTDEMRAELYLAACLAIEADTAAEGAFLSRLAAALALDGNLVAHLQAAARAAKGSA